MPFGPTPDLDRKTVAWAGVNTDGSPCTGRIIIRYEGPVMLDDDPVMPISVYPSRTVVPLATRTLILQDGELTSTQVVGYAEVLLPASNDPDLAGSGGTYLVVEDLDEGNGLTKSVVVDVGATSTIWLNRQTSVTSQPGSPVPTVTVADLVAVRGLVAVNQQAITDLTFTTSATQQQVGDILTDVAGIEDGPDLVLLYANAKV